MAAASLRTTLASVAVVGDSVSVRITSPWSRMFTVLAGGPAAASFVFGDDRWSCPHVWRTVEGEGTCRGWQEASLRQQRVKPQAVGP